jgi:integrase
MSGEDRPFGPSGPWLSQRPERPFYYITWFDRHSRQTKRLSTGSTDKTEALRLLAKWWVRNKELHGEDLRSVPLGVVLDRYYSEHASKLPSAQQASVAIGFWKKFFGSLTIGELTPKRQGVFVEWLRSRGHNDNYIRRTQSVAIAALNRAHRLGEIASVPPVTLLERIETRRQILTLTDVAALFDAAATDHFHLWLMIAFGTAARPGAILQLKTDQIDLTHRLIDFNPVGRAQTKKRRPVLPICDALLPWLRNLEPGFVIRWKRDQEEPIKRIQTAFDAARTRAKFSPAITPYSIRHTVAVELRKRGVPMAEVAGFLGHKLERFATTEIYARYAPDYRGAAIRAIDDFFRELSPLLSRPLLGFELENQPTPNEQRAHCVPKLSALVPQVVDFMVGVTGFEPATPTSRT